MGFKETSLVTGVKDSDYSYGLSAAILKNHFSQPVQRNHRKAIMQHILLNSEMPSKAYAISSRTSKVIKGTLCV
jgi:hypothetical protein